MKRAVILHGTNASPDKNWFPWLKKFLEQHDYQVWVPELPHNDTPNRFTYNDFLLNSGWDFADNLVIGHSSGAVSVLNLISDERCPKIKTAVMVGVWTDNAGTHLDPERFKDLFPENGFNPVLLKSKSDNMLFVHGELDPTCPLEQAVALAKSTSSEVIIVSGGNHLTADYPELPQLTSALELHGWL
jgi:predicted alpha/beta hydrolase family esterase